MKFDLSRENFIKITPISNFIKICPVGGGVFHADKRTDMATLIIAFRNFANAPQMRSSALHTEQLVETRKLLIVVESMYVYRTDCNKYAV
jgi:hypothetical protein